MIDLNKFRNSKFFNQGLPFFISCLSCAYMLSFFVQIKFDYKDNNKITTKTKELLKIIGREDHEERTLEDEYEEMVGKADLDSWKNIRGPRPWESDNEDYLKLIEKRAKESNEGWLFKPKKRDASK